MSQPEPWEMEGSNDHSVFPSSLSTGFPGTQSNINKSAVAPSSQSNDDEDEPPNANALSVKQRVAYLQSRLAPGAPIVGTSGNEKEELQGAAGAVRRETTEETWESSKYAGDNLKEGSGGDDNDGSDGYAQGNQRTPSSGRNPQDRANYARERLQPGAPLVGTSGNESTLASPAKAAAATTPTTDTLNAYNIDEETDPWHSAMSRYNEESNSKLDASNTGRVRFRSKEMNAMDQMGAMEIESEHVPPSHSFRNDGMDSTIPSAAAESVDGDLTLWQTFKLLYRRHTVVKYCLIGLFLLLIATAVILGVSLSKKGGEKKECSAASYNTEQPFLLLPSEGGAVKAGAFGASLDATNEYLVVGAPSSTCNTQGDCTVGGGAYLYQRYNNKDQHWTLSSAFILDDGQLSGDQFGKSVSIAEDSNTIAVGAPLDDGFGVASGAIYVMEAPFKSTTPPLRLVSDDIGVNDEFGISVGVSVTTLPSLSGSDDVQVTNIVVGASSDDDSGANSGGVYVFSKFGGVPPAGACGGRNVPVGEYVQCQKLLPDDGSTMDRFGRSVDISGRTVVVGADWDDNDGMIDSGSVYVYSLDDQGNWGLQQKIVRDGQDETTANKFGTSVSTSGDRIVIGTELDDAQGKDSGAAYVYRLSNRVWRLESDLVPAKDVSNPIHDGWLCGTSVDISSDGRTIIVGCPEASGGGLVFVYNLHSDGNWKQSEKLITEETFDDQYTTIGVKLGMSVAVTPGENGMIVAGYGIGGEVVSFAKDC
jgi:hypothetical protein